MLTGESSRAWPPHATALAAHYAQLRHPALVPVVVQDGPPLTVRAVTDPTGRPDLSSTTDPTAALQAMGEVALGLAALHDLGLAHGAVTAEQIRDAGGHWVLAGVAAPGDENVRRGDVRSLAEAATAALGPAAGRSDVAGLLEAMRRGDVTAAEAGRTALASATSPQPETLSAPQRGIAPPAADKAAERDVIAADREAQRRRVRNGLIAVGVVVVLAGAFGLRQLDQHGIVRVPDVRGRSQSQAKSQLTDAGLVTAVSTVPAPTGAAPGTVITQSPAANTQVRPGRTVLLRVAASDSVDPMVSRSPGGSQETHGHAG